LFLFFSSIAYRFSECQPPETARIARLPARYAQGGFSTCKLFCKLVLQMCLQVDVEFTNNI
jgi:hypothetical protein